MKLMRIALVFFLVMITPFWAFAQEEAAASDEASEGMTEPYSEHSLAAWHHVNEILSDFMPVHVASEMSLIAYHLAAEQMCDGVHTDPAKSGAAILELRPTNWDDLSEKAQQHWRDQFLTGFGIVLGVMIAEHAEHLGSFCEEVGTLITTDGNDWHYFDTSQPPAESES